MLPRSRARPTLADGHRIGRLARQFQAPHQDQIDRQAAEQLAGVALDGLADVNVAASLAPEVEKELAELFHKGPCP